MEIPIERIGGTLVLMPNGRIDGQNALEFQAEIDGLISNSDSTVILELNNLSYISSAGLRVILLLAKTLKSRNMKFGMCNISDAVKDVFDISGFNKIISTHNTRQQAIAALG